MEFIMHRPEKQKLLTGPACSSACSSAFEAVGMTKSGLKHAFKLGSVLMPTLTLELRDHPLLGLATHTTACQQAPGPVLFVEVLENILVLQKTKDCDNFLEAAVYLRIAGQALQNLPKELVNV